MTSKLEWGYFYGLLGAIMAGLHMFSLKLLSSHASYFYSILLVVIVTMILSRLCIYFAMDAVSNPTLVHLLMNCSIFVTFLLSIIVLGLKDFHTGMFVVGLIFTIIGMACIQYSYTTR